ncbi:polysaccharide biosynthesis/export family protein [Verrucomicrobiota bacterium]
MKKSIILVALICVATQSVCARAWFRRDRSEKKTGAPAVAVAAKGEGRESDNGAAKQKNHKNGEPRLSPGYVLTVTVVVAGDKEIQDTDRRIQNDGTVALTLLGSVKAEGRTLKEFRNHLYELYNKSYFVNPQVSVDFVFTPGQAGISPWGYVTVLGRVKQPGRVNIPPTGDLRLTHAIQQAGGFDTSAKDTDIRITRIDGNGETKRIEINLRNIGSKGKTGDDIVLQAGDVVFVPEMIF